MLFGQRVPAGRSWATVLPEIDFETYSAAGYEWFPDRKRWGAPTGTRKGLKPGLSLVGAARYFEHPTTEVLFFSYDLKDGLGMRRGTAANPPADLIAWLTSFDPNEPASYTQRGIIEAWNAIFELRVFLKILHEQFGWPKLDPRQFRCAMAKAAAFCLPPSLGKCGEVLQLTEIKDAEGDRLIKKFSMPQNPTKAQPYHRLFPSIDPVDGPKFQGYCDQDCRTEAEASLRMPDLRPIDLEFWLVDLECNLRGVQIDVETAQAAGDILQQASNLYDPEIQQITGGFVARTSEVSKLMQWINGQDPRLRVTELDDDAIDVLFERDDLADNVRRALTLRAMTSSASVKKVYAMARMCTSEGRAHDLHVFNGARTGRDTHRDLQPGNLPKAGPAIRWCDDVECQRPYAHARSNCPWCGADAAFSSEFAPGTDEKGWNWRAVPYAAQVIRSRRLDWLQAYFGDAFLTITGCIRGLFTAAPGHQLISSDYSSIEAVVTACLSGEQWRIDAFRNKEDIYLHGAAGVTGRTYEWYFQNGGKRHPDRQKIGKPAELGLGFGGWIGAWRQFDKTDTFTDEEVKANIVAWREASPAIVEFWGGQTRGKPWRPDRYELFGLEGMAVAALLEPGTVHEYRGIKYQVLNGTLYCTLLSGRDIAYHCAKLVRQERFEGVQTWAIHFWGWNTNPNKGARGWIQQELYGGLMAENVVQATANDVLRNACVELRKEGYPVVMRVHDELVAEIIAPPPVPAVRDARVQHFESVMCRLPAWCADWPIRASGGWIGDRFRKDG